MKKFFYGKDIKNVVIFGGNYSTNEIIDINKKKNLKTFFFSTKDQVQNFKIPTRNSLVSEKLSKDVINYIEKKFKFEETIFISIGSRYIFSREVISKTFNSNIFNFHDTRLPFDKGGATISWFILKGERIASQLVHLIDEKIDTGPIIKQETYVFPINCLIPKDFEEFRKKKFIPFYQSFILDILQKRSFDTYSQVNFIGSYNPRLDTKINGYIDWSFKSNSLVDFIRAFDDPYLGASTFININKKSKKVYLKKAQLHLNETPNHEFMKGIIKRHNFNFITVATSDHGSLIIEEVFDDNNINVIKSLKEGDRFYTPLKYLETSMQFRARF